LNPVCGGKRDSGNAEIKLGQETHTLVLSSFPTHIGHYLKREHLGLGKMSLIVNAGLYLRLLCLLCG